MPSVSLENPNEVFEDGENPPSSRSSESGFTEFVQYQADTTDDIDRALNEGHSAPGIPIIGSTSSETETASTVGSEETIVQPPSMMTQGTATRSGENDPKDCNAVLFGVCPAVFNQIYQPVYHSE